MMLFKIASILMYNLFHDRTFWIYFIITLFFIIIGLASIISANVNPAIAIFWLIANVALMILIYHASTQFSGDFTVYYIFVNMLFLVLLIISIVWTGELKSDTPLVRSGAGILSLLGGLIICKLATMAEYTSYIQPIWIAIAYLLIWFGLTWYVTVS